METTGMLQKSSVDGPRFSCMRQLERHGNTNLACSAPWVEVSCPEKFSAPLQGHINTREPEHEALQHISCFDQQPFGFDFGLGLAAEPESEYKCNFHSKVLALEEPAGPSEGGTKRDGH